MEVIQDPARLIAFVTFSAVVAGTPGPSNALLTAVGARAGVRQGLASLLGQVTGMGAMLFAITLGLGNVLLAHPLALQVLKWGGAAMLGWMAWRIGVHDGLQIGLKVEVSSPSERVQLTAPLPAWRMPGCMPRCRRSAVSLDGIVPALTGHAGKQVSSPGTVGPDRPKLGRAYPADPLPGVALPAAVDVDQPVQHLTVRLHDPRP